MRSEGQGRKEAPSTQPSAAPARPRKRAAQRRERRRAGAIRRCLTAAILAALALSLIVAAAGLDSYLHRGVVFGVPEPAPPTAGPLLGMNVFLEKEVDRDNVRNSVRLLRDNNVAFVRQTFSWAAMEPQPGQYQELDKYDFIVEQLSAAGIGILARVDTIPRWARPPTDNLDAWDKGPPQDFDNYANFVAFLAERYRDRVSHFQVWNEPNLTGEWGGKPIDPAQYALLLQRTYPKVKAANPAALVVTAGLAQTVEDGVTTNNLSELAFIQGLYDAGAADSFDILSVMAYGLGDSPEDRRVDPLRTNFSRLQLVRDVMVRNGDATTPIWVSEYGWISLPEGWTGPRGSWRDSVSEETQARYLTMGLDRTRREWPWVGAVFVWGFRWVESPREQPNEPARYFEVVNYDFTPRPAFVALGDWSHKQAVATSGALAAGDRRLVYGDGWRPQTLAGREYRVADGRGATLRLRFQGNELRMRARTGPTAGRCYVAIDGRPVADLPDDDGGSYLSLGNTRVEDDDIPIASELPEGEHTLEIRVPDGSTLALNEIAIGRRQPFAWAAPLLFIAGLGGLFAGLLLGARALAAGFGWLPAPGRAAPPLRGRSWWDTRE